MQPWRLSGVPAAVFLAPAAVLASLALFAGVAAPGASGVQDESDNELDRFMERVLAQRERNAAARLQYVLDEELRIRLTGPDGVVWGFRGQYTWYERDGFFVRSPTRIDGVAIDEASRREYEAEWLTREQQRLEERQEERLSPARASPAAGRDGASLSPADAAWAGIEPRFVSDAYFLEFEFEPGNYYLAGRETLDGHDVLRIEYYPEQLFTEPDDDGAGSGTERPSGGNARDPGSARAGNDREAAAMDKTSLVTLWVDPARHQIVRYTFDNVGFDFLPGRWLLRLDDLTASMTMRQPFEGVWLPERTDMRAAVSLAIGAFELSGTRVYTNYREATAGGRILAIGPDRPR